MVGRMSDFEAFSAIYFDENRKKDGYMTLSYGRQKWDVAQGCESLHL